MQYRRFGRTELSIPVFSCGGMRYQHSWKDVPEADIPKENQKNLEATIHRSLELGINHIETARGYGSSELQLGKVLRTLPRDSFIFQTKVAPSQDPKEFLATFEKSMSCHGIEHVDLFSIHGINNPEIWEHAKGCLDIARTLQKEGRIRHIGFSTHAHVTTICETIDSGAFDYVNLHWYWIFQNNWPAIERANMHDMGVFIISPNDKGGMLYKPTDVFRRHTEPHSPMVFNNLFCLQSEAVHTLSIGASRPEDFDEHLKTLDSLDHCKKYVSETNDALMRRIDETVGKDWWHHITHELPDWWEIPQKINIRIILWLWSLDRAFGMREYAELRYGLLGNGGHWFPGKKAANVDGIEWESVLRDSPFASLIPDRLKEAHRLYGKKENQRLSVSD